MNRKGFISNLYLVVLSLIIFLLALVMVYFIRSDIQLGKNIIITRLLEH